MVLSIIFSTNEKDKIWTRNTSKKYKQKMLYGKCINIGMLCKKKINAP